MGRKRLKKTGPRIDVDRILADHAASLRQPATRWVSDEWSGRRVEVPVTAETEIFTRPPVSGQAHNTDSARQRKARSDAARARTGNRGSGKPSQ